jgi:hypothetical protein
VPVQEGCSIVLGVGRSQNTSGDPGDLCHTPWASLATLSATVTVVHLL